MNPSSSPARLRPFRPVPFGRYTLLSQLATGGMGEIFLARLEGAQGFEKLCVIKKILPQLAEDPEFVERFVGEARTLVKLSHGSIAQVLDMGLTEGEAYMALEHVDGKDLRKVAARARDRQMPLPLTFVLFVMGRVLDALAYAHRKKGDDEGELNLVHRDISPQNILISYEGEVKVIDFGLAKSRLSAARTNPSVILGKFLYMSPEQARHQPVDRRSDLYAVGLCLYELISGRNPFDLLPPGELMPAVAQPNIRPLGEVEPSVPPAVAQLVMRALAVEPAQRFQTAEELRGKLNACLLVMDPSSGPESVSRYMHELFASEYQAERRLLAALKEAGRAPEPEPVVMGVLEREAPRPASTPPPKTNRPEGTVEPLSFRPTPRTREGVPVWDDGETRQGAVMDAPTRPAIVVEAIEEAVRARSSSSAAMGPPTVEVSGLEGAPVTSPGPALTPMGPVSRPASAPTQLAVPQQASPGTPRAAPSAPVVPMESRSSGMRPAASSAPPVVSAESRSSGMRPALVPSGGLSGSSLPTREVPVSDVMLRASTPMATQVPPVDLAQVPIEDTPVWSEALSAEEDLGAIESSSESEDARTAPPVPFGTDAVAQEVSDELPGFPAFEPSVDDASLPFHTSPPEEDVELASPTDAEAEVGVDVSLDDTNPRIQMPHSSQEPTNPRAARSSVYHQDTQPRALIGEAFLRQEEKEEKEEISQSGRSRPGGARVTSRRPAVTGTSGPSTRSPSSSPKLAPVAERGQEARNDASGEVVDIPTASGTTRRTSAPQRPTSPLKWTGLVLGLLLLGGGTGAVVFFALKPEPEVKPPPARPLFPPGAKAPRAPQGATPPSPTAAAPASPDTAPASPDTATASPDTATASVAAQADSEPTAVAPAETLAEASNAVMAEALPEADTGSTPDAPAPAAPPEEALSPPPTPPSGNTASSSTNKRGTLRRRTSRGQSTLQKEWARTKGAFKALNRTYGCEILNFLCVRYDLLEAKVSSKGDAEDPALLAKVRELHQDILNKKKNGP
ncbi:MAG TPA: protein kinase [Archangium sp.]|jgi:serine/threonine-protein kinase